MAGGNSGGVESYLPIAAALAATIATDGAASPWLVEAMGATGAAALTSGAAAAAASGLTAAVTGQDVGRSALMGGISGGLGGALGAATPVNADAVALGGAGGGGAFTPAAGSGASFAIDPTATYAVSGTAALAPSAGVGMGANVSGQIGADITSMVAANPGNMDIVAQSLQNTYGMTANQANAAIAQNMAGTSTTNGINMATANAADKAAGIASNVGPSTLQAPANLQGPASVKPPPGFWDSSMGTAAKLGIGGGALAYLIQQDNNKYGTPDTQPYEGPLTDFHYSRENYTPLTTAQPSPDYKPVYPNYVKNPYNAYAAQGGQVVSMAQGGIAGATPNTDGSGQMFQTNGVAQNQIYPQSTINSNAFSNATNVPISQNIVSGISDASVDPYTGAQRFAEGGTTEAKGIPLQAMPNFITQNAVGNNNALTQDLVSRMAARNAANPMPGQTPPIAPIQPAGIMAAAPYTAPTFNRPTNVSPIEFQNPGAIVGTKTYNDRIAAEAAAEAERQAAIPSYNPFSTDSSPGGGDGGGGGEAAGGLMHAYAHGGTAQSHLGSYSDGGRLLKGPGDGMSDNIPAQIGAKQPARLADGEFVVPADVVSHLGNGSTDAGAKKFYAMMDRVRAARTGTKKQGKQIKADKYLKA